MLRLTGRALTAEYRPRALGALTVFGGDTALFFTLYSAIWPRYEGGVNEAADALWGLQEVDYCEIHAAWEFVQDGWHETAEGNW